MAIEKVKEYFKKYNMDNRILEFNESSATVLEAAHALGCASEKIAKTLSFDLNDKYILIVLAGDARVDNHKYNLEFGKKAKMIKLEEAEEIIGHSVGGVCPFAINDDIDVYLDESLKRFTTVFPACGSANSAIELTIKELEEYSNYIKWVDVSKLSEG